MPIYTGNSTVNTTIKVDRVKLPILASDISSPATGEMFFNTTSGSLRLHTGAGFVSVGSTLGQLSTNPAANATHLIAAGFSNNGYYYVNLGSSTQLIYCILDGSIEIGHGYMRLWDERSQVQYSNTMHHFDSNMTDYAAFKNAGGEGFTISEFAIATANTWSYGNGGNGYNNSSIRKYNTNAGSGISASYSPKTLTTIFNTGWSYSGAEADNYKNFGYSGNTVLDQLYLMDDNDAINAGGRQTSLTNTPKGMLSFGSVNSNYFVDGGTRDYQASGYGFLVSALYVR